MTTKTPVRCYFDKKSSFLRRNSEKKSRSRRLKKLPEQDGNDLIIVPGKNKYSKRIQSPYASLEVVKNAVEYAKEHFD